MKPPNANETPKCHAHGFNAKHANKSENNENTRSKMFKTYLDSRSLWAEVSSMYQGVCGKLSWCKWRRHDDDMPMAW